MATYNTQIVCPTGANTSKDLSVRPGTKIEGASVSSVNLTAHGNVAVELLLVNKSRGVTAGFLASGWVWKGARHGKTIWNGLKTIPNSGEYVVRATVANDTGIEVTLDIAVQDNQP